MDTIKLALTVLVRYLIVAACAWLIRKGVLNQGDAATFEDPTVIASIVVGLLTIAAGIYVRLRSRFKTNVALTLPQNATYAQVDAATAQASVAQVISTNPAPKQP